VALALIVTFGGVLAVRATTISEPASPPAPLCLG
jgi:hypothetical protein